RLLLGSCRGDRLTEGSQLPRRCRGRPRLQFHQCGHRAYVRTHDRGCCVLLGWEPGWPARRRARMLGERLSLLRSRSCGRWTCLYFCECECVPYLRRDREWCSVLLG